MAIRSNINDKIEMIQINSVPKKNPEQKIRIEITLQGVDVPSIQELI